MGGLQLRPRKIDFDVRTCSEEFATQKKYMFAQKKVTNHHNHLKGPRKGFEIYPPVTRGSTARATHRAVPLPNRRRPPKVLVCLQTVHFCVNPFRTQASGPFWKTMVFIRRWEVLTCGSPTIRTSNSGRSSPRLANDLWFTHMLNVQRWEVFA